MTRIQSVCTILMFSFFAACSSGNQDDSEKATPSRGESPSAVPISKRMIGRWHLTLKSVVDATPPDKRANIAAMYYAVCREEPTLEQLDAAGLSTAAKVGVYSIRAKLASGKKDDRLNDFMKRLDKVKSSLPIFEFMDGNVLETEHKGKKERATYTIESETNESITIKITEENDSDGPETFTVRMEGNNVLIMEDTKGEEGAMVFAREGTGDSLDSPEVSSPPKGDPVPQGLLGRWKSSGRRKFDIEILPNNRFILHSAGSSEGYYWVTSVEGNKISIKRYIPGFTPHQLADTNEIVINGDSLTWYIPSFDDRFKLTRQ